MALVYIDGGWYSKKEAKISVYDHGLLYGDGLFEGIRIYAGKIFKLQEHLDRLYAGAKAISLEIPLKPGELAGLLEEGVRREGKREGYIRLVVTRGVGDLGINPRLCPRPTVIIITDDIQLYPREHYEKGIAIVTAPTRRIQGDIFDPRIKSLNYLNNVMAKIEAQLAGCLEAVLLNREGYVSECTGDNIFIVTKGVLKTPAPWLGLLEGITRNTVLELAVREGIPVQETTLTRFDLFTADECFLTGSGAEMIPVTKVDGRTVGSGAPGPVTARLTEAFKRLVNENPGKT
jgi:branched-chain amino acid aminotransferase